MKIALSILSTAAALACSCSSLPQLPARPVLLSDPPDPALFGDAAADAEPANMALEFNSALSSRWSQPPVAADKEIFSIYNKGAESKRADNWLKDFDFSGVAMDNTRTCTLITPQHVVMSKHYQRALGSTVMFHDPSGKPVARTLIGRESISFTDITVGLLDAPADGCAVYPVLPAWGDGTVRLWERALVRAYAIVTDQERKGLIYGISQINGSFCIIRNHSPQIMRERIISGDSGGPSFLPYGRNKLALLTLSWYGGAGISGPDFSNAKLQAAIRAAITKLDQNK